MYSGKSSDTLLLPTLGAYATSFGQLSPSPNFISVKQVPIIKGDAKSISIGAASIIAKVTRDRLMKEYDAIMPEYGFAQNKGYGTKEHIEALQKYGPSPIHRKSFIGHFVECE